MRLTNNYDRIYECTARIIEWLHQVWQMTRDGRVDQLQPDPFYLRNVLLTPEVVDKVVAAVENDIFAHELKHYMGYHVGAQGNPPGTKLVPPGFNKLSRLQQFALVQGVDRITKEYEASDDEPEYQYDDYPYAF